MAFKLPIPFSQKEVICLNCRKPISLRITQEFTTEKCFCCVVIWYPPHSSRPYGIRKIIRKEEYDPNFKKKTGENNNRVREKSKFERTIEGSEKSAEF